MRALFAADELSMDFDWRRVRLSVLHPRATAIPATGGTRDSTPYSRGPFRRLGLEFLLSSTPGVGVAAPSTLKSRDGLLPSLRPAGNSIESNFSNPGLNLLGAGLDLSLCRA